jgi:hypothetical protein
MYKQIHIDKPYFVFLKRGIMCSCFADGNHVTHGFWACALLEYDVSKDLGMTKDGNILSICLYTFCINLRHVVFRELLFV